MNYVYLSLGSNQGDRQLFLDHARSLITALIGPVLSSSSRYESEPWGFESTNVFVNEVLLVESKFTAEEILTTIGAIEAQLGRNRAGISGGYVDRCIDVDIIYFNSEVISSEKLTVPHKYRFDRDFVYVPLLEIAPDFVDPLVQISIQDYVERGSLIVDTLKRC